MDNFYNRVLLIKTLRAFSKVLGKCDVKSCISISSNWDFYQREKYVWPEELTMPEKYNYGLGLMTCVKIVDDYLSRKALTTSAASHSVGIVEDEPSTV